MKYFLCVIYFFDYSTLISTFGLQKSFCDKSFFFKKVFFKLFCKGLYAKRKAMKNEHVT